MTELDELRQRLGRAERQVELLESTLRSRTDETLRTTRTLRSAREFLRAVYRAMPGAMLFIDEGGMIFDANDTLLAMLGRRPEEVIGSPAASWFVDLDFCATLHAGELEQTERRLRTETGELPVLVSATVVTVPGDRRRAIVCIATDLSDRKRMEADLRRAHKLESVGRLAAGVAHELNTPMQFVTDSVCFAQETLAELLEGGSPDTAADVSSALALAVTGLRRIAEIVQSMSVLAQPERVRASVDLERTIRSALVVAAGEYKPVAEVIVELAELPPVIGVASELAQALLNLIVNAGEAIARTVAGTHQRGVLRVTAHARGRHVEIAIADTGPGIPEAIREHIFDPFFTTKQVGQGAGQGLAVAHAVICELHGGTIAVDTELGRGTTFIVRIPIDGDGGS